MLVFVEDIRTAQVSQQSHDHLLRRLVGVKRFDLLSIWCKLKHALIQVLTARTLLFLLNCILSGFLI